MNAAWRRHMACALVAVFALPPALEAQQPAHPMDPLTPAEITRTAGILRSAGLLAGETKVVKAQVQEPPKSLVSAWDGSARLPRRAFVVLKRGSSVLEVVVNLGSSSVESRQELTSVQPFFLSSEWDAMSRLVKADPRWQEAMRKRGYTDFGAIYCIAFSAGYYGNRGSPDGRLWNMLSFDTRGVSNFFGRPIEGVVAVTDPNKGEVVEVIDTGVVAVPASPVDFDAASVGALRRSPRAAAGSSPRGSSLRVEGNVVRWQKWSFHFRMDPQVGTVVSLVRYEDAGAERSILYQGALSEIFVPYMDPSSAWYFRTLMDAGEFAIGHAASRLIPGRDCPANARLFDVAFMSENGTPARFADAVALFERYKGDPAWRHQNSLVGRTESRQARELVLRMITTLGNYDYILDWVFDQSGSIRVAVGATGIVAVKAVPQSSAGNGGDEFGRFVAPNIVAVNHGHFFNYRLDLDVDGPANSFVKTALKKVSWGNETPREGGWVLESRPARRERDAKLTINLQTPSVWRIVSAARTNHVGNPTSYQIRPFSNAVSLLSKDDYPQRRAGFTDYHLWVTPYNPKERHAGGDYPNQSRGGQGLPEWTQRNREIYETDIVAWYTLGFHHVVRSEDWPVMPTVWHEFELRPFDFFDRNPSLDLP